MNSKDYDRKFWLVVEQGNKKIYEFHLNFKGNSFLCYSYFSQEHIAYGVGPGLVYEAVYGAIYVDGEYSINEEPLYDKTTRYFTQDKLNGFLVIPINNKAINIYTKNFPSDQSVQHQPLSLKEMIHWHCSPKFTKEVWA